MEKYWFNNVSGVPRWGSAPLRGFANLCEIHIFHGKRENDDFHVKSRNFSEIWIPEAHVRKHQLNHIFSIGWRGASGARSHDFGEIHENMLFQWISPKWHHFH